METHSLKLLCGLEAEITPMLGKHQRLVNAEGMVSGRSLNLLVASCTTRIGDKSPVTEEDVKLLPVGEKKKLLVNIRQLSNDWDPEFKFVLDWKDPATGETKKQTLEVEIPKAFDERGYRKMKEDGTFELGPAGEPEEEKAATWAELMKLKVRRVRLPKSGKLVEFSLLDGAGEARGHKNPRKSHMLTLIEIRDPKELLAKETGTGYNKTSLDLDELPWRDIEFLRRVMIDAEPNMDTELQIVHPATEETEAINLVSIPAFFFPSVEHL